MKYYRINKQKWDDYAYLWNAELEKGHIDLVSPRYKPIDYWFDIEIEIDSSLLNRYTNEHFEDYYSFNDDYLVGDGFKWFLFVDVVYYYNLMGYKLTGFYLDLIRDIKLSKLI